VHRWGPHLYVVGHWACSALCSAPNYEGIPQKVTKRCHSINFKNMKYKKIRKMHFVGNIILIIRCEFCYDDFTVTSFINTATESIPERRSVINFLWEKLLGTNPIHSETNPVYGDKCFIRSATHLWRKKKVTYTRNDLVCPVITKQQSQQSILSYGRF